MRIYTHPLQAVQEVERDLYEMGILVPVQTMQDKVVANNPDYVTQEVRHYGFTIQSWAWREAGERDILNHIFKDDVQTEAAMLYIGAEFFDRVSGSSRNPGNAWQHRANVWNEFMHDGRFAYTYSERMSPQLPCILDELREKPGTRQAIINIHSNINTTNHRQGGVSNNPWAGADLENMGGKSRIPCSLYYQIMIRERKVDLVYAMRSCDFLTHFPIDLMLALRLQTWFAQRLDLDVGMFTYFTGSLHAYMKQMKERGIF